MIKTFTKIEVIGNNELGFGLQITFPTGEEREYISLFVNREDAERLRKKMERLGVSECNIYDIIEDSLP